jgi:hypothetical protein
MRPGDTIEVAKPNEFVEAQVICAPDDEGWLRVEQITHYEDRVAGDRPRYHVRAQDVR